jgi:hypothetical protein
MIGDSMKYDPSKQLSKRHGALKERIDKGDDIGRIILDLRTMRANAWTHRGSIKNDILWLQDVYKFGDDIV